MARTLATIVIGGCAAVVASTVMRRSKFAVSRYFNTTNTYRHPRLRYWRQLLIDAGLGTIPLPLALMATLLICVLVFKVVQGATGGNTAAGLALAPLGAIGVEAFLERAGRRRNLIYQEQITSFIESMSHMIPIHQSTYRAIMEYARSAPEPLAKELNHVVVEYMNGTPLSETLSNWAKRSQNRYLDMMAGAIAVYEKNGGPIEDIVRQISNSIMEERMLDTERKSETAGQSLIVTILMLATILLYVLLHVTGPTMLEPLHTTKAGHVVMTVVAINQLLIVLYIRYMMRGEA